MQGEGERTQNKGKHNPSYLVKEWAQKKTNKSAAKPQNSRVSTVPTHLCGREKIVFPYHAAVDLTGCQVGFLLFLSYVVLLVSISSV